MKMHLNDQNSLPTKKQCGAVLIVSLVMLTILTIIAIGTTTDVGLQTNMAKNSQISIRAFNASMSHLREKYISLTNNGAFEKVLGDILITEETITENTAHSANNPFDLTFSIEYLGEGDANVHGSEVGNAFNRTSHLFELHSVSDTPNSTLGSNQTYGVTFLKTD